MRPLIAALVPLLFAAASFAQAPAERKKPLRVLVVCAEGELRDYERYLEKQYAVTCAWAGGKAGKVKEVTGLEKLKDCDVLLVHLHRTTPSAEQLKYATDYFAAGRPVVGLRKASHGFQNWLQIDREVFGAKYGGHFLQEREKELVMRVEEKGKASPLLEGFTPFLPGGGLYRYTELAPDVEVLISGGVKGNMMPQVWSRVHRKTGARVFYARYDPNDLKKDEGCRRMIARALFWAANRPVEKK